MTRSNGPFCRTRTTCAVDASVMQVMTIEQGKERGENTLLRADSFGKNTTSPTDYMADPVLRAAHW